MVTGVLCRSHYTHCGDIVRDYRHGQGAAQVFRSSRQVLKRITCSGSSVPSSHHTVLLQFRFAQRCHYRGPSAGRWTYGRVARSPFQTSERKQTPRGAPISPRTANRSESVQRPKWFWIGTVTYTIGSGRIVHWNIERLLRQRWKRQTGLRTNSTLDQRKVCHS
jgi:hypothetical protein